MQEKAFPHLNHLGGGIQKQCNVVCGMTQYIIHRTYSFGTLTLGTTLYLQRFVRAPHTITASSNL